MDGHNGVDRLWVPALTHYRLENGEVVLDGQRILAHVQAMKPAVRQLLLAGSTGDGWQMSLDQVMALLELTSDEQAFSGVRFLVGVLRPTTEEVVAWAVEIERRLAALKTAGEFVGFAVCPPIDAGASQDRILEHYKAVIDSTTAPIAAYQLPQVTNCRIEHGALEALARTGRVSMFKDTSGEDTVARAGRIEGVSYVRGAEGKYLDFLAPAGPYDGWLLSSGNVFGDVLRTILDLRAAGDDAAAASLSDVMTELVAGMFSAAGELTFGNPFSNANRAGDHLLAYGSSWRERPRPLAISGDHIPDGVLEATEALLGRMPSVRKDGYLAHA